MLAQRCILGRMITVPRAGVSVAGTVVATSATGIVTEIETGDGNGTMRKRTAVETIGPIGMVQNGLETATADQETGPAQSAISTVFHGKRNVHSVERPRMVRLHLRALSQAKKAKARERARKSIENQHPKNTPRIFGKPHVRSLG